MLSRPSPDSQDSHCMLPSGASGLSLKTLSVCDVGIIVGSEDRPANDLKRITLSTADEVRWPRWQAVGWSGCRAGRRHRGPERQGFTHGHTEASPRFQRIV